MPKITPELAKLREFLDKPGINISGICAESDINRRHFEHILKGDRTFTEATKAKLKPVLENYGFNETL